MCSCYIAYFYFTYVAPLGRTMQQSVKSCHNSIELSIVIRLFWLYNLAKRKSSYSSEDKMGLETVGKESKENRLKKQICEEIIFIER